MEVTYCGFYLGFIVYAYFYWAINNEPDYMPSQKNKQMMESPEQMNHAEMHSSSAQ